MRLNSCSDEAKGGCQHQDSRMPNKSVSLLPEQHCRGEPSEATKKVFRVPAVFGND